MNEFFQLEIIKIHAFILPLKLSTKTLGLKYGIGWTIHSRLLIYPDSPESTSLFDTNSNRHYPRQRASDIVACFHPSTRQ